MKERKIVSILLLFSLLSGNAFASSFSLDSLVSGYSLYSDLTSTQYPTVVKYGEGALNTVKNSSGINVCSHNSFVGNNGETFVFSSCGYNITPPTFSTNGNLLNLWQAGREDVNENITNKAKFLVYSKLFKAIKNNYAFNKGVSMPDFPASLNKEYFQSSEDMKKSIPPSYLISHSGADNSQAIDFLWQPGDISPDHYYSDIQKTAYQKFETTVLTVMKKVQAIKNTKTLSKLETALLKVLKNPKGKTDNDKYLMFMIIYEMVLEQLGK